MLKSAAVKNVRVTLGKDAKWNGTPPSGCGTIHKVYEHTAIVRWDKITQGRDEITFEHLDVVPVVTNDRKTSFSSIEFKALPKYKNGDLKELSNAYPWFTQIQRKELSEDDFSRVQELDDEINYMLHELVAEFHD